MEILENSPLRTNSPASGSEKGTNAPFNATTALLNQIKNLGNNDKNVSQKVQPITLIKPQVGNNNSNSTTCIKDALEQLLSKKSVPVS